MEVRPTLNTYNENPGGTTSLATTSKKTTMNKSAHKISSKNKRPIFLQAYSHAVVRDITLVASPHKASPDLAERQRGGLRCPSDAFAASDGSEAALIARGTSTCRRGTRNR